MLLLAWRYVRYHKLISCLLVGGLTLVIAFPLVAWKILRIAEQRYGQRASRTPLVIGRKSNPYALTLKSLYYQGRNPPPFEFKQVRTVLKSDPGTVLPMFMAHTANGFPLVGTDHEYYAFRGLALREGSFPTRLGECVVGAKVAQRGNLKPGTHLITDNESFLNIAHAFPFRLSIAGVLRQTGGPDDRAVFTDLKTAWVIKGLGHGHENVPVDSGVAVDLAKAAPEKIEQAVAGVLGKGVKAFQEVTSENIETFHFHGDVDTFPIHAVIVRPRSTKAGTLLKARMNASEDLAVLVPEEIIGHLMRIVFNIKKVFNGYFLMMILATLSFLVITVLLSLRARREEFALMARMGCSSRTIFTLILMQFSIVLAISVLLSLCLSQLATFGLEYYLI